jgi:Fe-S cluster biosynthesis and repair protein YggX
MATVHCTRCGLDGERQAFKPFPTDRGQLIYDTICRACWAEWLKAQQQLINHYALVPHQPKSREFLLHNMEQFLFGAGAPDQVP